MSDLATLQKGSFEDRLWLWLKIVSEVDEDLQVYLPKATPEAQIITKMKLNSVIRASFP